MPTYQPPDHTRGHSVFPQELFDRLIDVVEVDSSQRPALLDFSLVSKAWACHSRKRIFRIVNLRSRNQFKLWCKNIPPGPGGPSSLVRVLCFSQMEQDDWITPSTLLEGEEHLMSFTNLNGFFTFGFNAIYFADRASLTKCFRAIGQDLRFARFHHVRGTPQTLMSLIQQFPTIQTLAIEYYTEVGHVPSEGPIDETIGQFQGCLRLLSIDIYGLSVIDSIARLPLKYEEVHLTSSLHFVQPYNRLFSACASTLERLRIIDTRKSRSHWATPLDSCDMTVINCTELQVVHLGTSRNPGPMLERLIKSINPSNIRELAFELIWDKYMNDDITSIVDIPAWKPIDDVLCDLAIRVRATHPERILNVVLSAVLPQSTDPGRVELGTLFSRFRERGNISLRQFVDYLPPGKYTTDMPLLALGGPWRPQ